VAEEVGRRKPVTDGRATLVIVPTYDERGSIAEVVERLFAACPDGVELLVVDDASPDATAGIVRDLARGNDRIHLIERTSKLGLGTAYVTGFKWAIARGYRAVVEMDGDLSHDPADVPRLLAALDEADLVVGSRYVPGGGVGNWGRARRLLSRGGNLYARAWLGFGVRDSTSGFRAYRIEALAEHELAGVRSEGYAFQIEMTRRLHRARRHIVEVPITFVERRTGKSKINRTIVVEAIARVTAWGLSDRLLRRG
jgi:dolichol-phosphate mannosyltransferase